VASISSSCALSYNQNSNAYPVASVNVSLAKGSTYEAAWAVDAQDGASLTYAVGGGYAGAAAAYGTAACYTWGGCTTHFSIYAWSW
jgi:hypothetical protein